MKIKSNKIDLLKKIAEDNLLSSLPEDIGELSSPLSLDKIEEYVDILLEIKDLTEEVANTDLTIKVEPKMILDEITDIISRKLDDLSENNLIESFSNKQDDIIVESASTSAQVLKRVCNKIREKLNDIAPVISQLKEECKSCDYFIDFDIISDVLTRVRKIEDLISGSLSRSVKVKKASFENKYAAMVSPSGPPTAPPAPASTTTTVPTTPPPTPTTKPKGYKEIQECITFINELLKKYDVPKFIKNPEGQKIVDKIKYLNNALNTLTERAFIPKGKTTTKIIKLSDNDTLDLSNDINTLQQKIETLFEFFKQPGLNSLTITFETNIRRLLGEIVSLKNEFLEKFNKNFGKAATTVVEDIVKYTTPKIQALEIEIQSLSKMLGQINNQTFKDVAFGKANQGTKQYYLNTIEELIIKEKAIKNLLITLNQSIAAAASQTASNQKNNIEKYAGLGDWINNLLGKVTPQNIEQKIQQLTKTIADDNVKIFYALNQAYMKGKQTLPPGDSAMAALENAMKTFQTLGFGQGQQGGQQTNPQQVQPQQGGGQKGGGQTAQDVINFLKGLPPTTTVGDALNKM